MQICFLAFLRRYALLFLLLAMWQGVVAWDLVPDYLVPSPLQILGALWQDRALLAQHGRITLVTALIGVLAGCALGFVLGVIMDASARLKEMLMPLLLINQTIPTIAIAPLLVIYLGYGILPKIVLVVMAVFFPLAIALIDGFGSINPQYQALFDAMGARRLDIYRHLKLPFALPFWFAGLKVAMSYALIATVVAEWVGGNQGLGVYMTRARKSFEMDNMFAVILLISFLTFLLMYLVDTLQHLIQKDNS